MSRRRTRRPRAGCCAGCALAVGLATLLAIYAGYQALSVPPGPPLPSPARRARLVQRMREVRRETLAIERDAAAGRPHPFNLTLTEQELNTYLATDASARRMFDLEHIRRAFVRIADGRVVATAVRATGGPDVALTASFVPEVQRDGTARFRVASVDVGRLPVPVDRVRRLAEEMARSLAAGVVRPGVRFRQVTVSDDRITAVGDTYRTNGRAPRAGSR